MKHIETPTFVFKYLTLSYYIVLLDYVLTNRYAGIRRTFVDQAKLAKLRATIVSEGTRGSGGGGGQQGFEALFFRSF